MAFKKLILTFLFLCGLSLGSFAQAGGGAGASTSSSSPSTATGPKSVMTKAQKEEAKKKWKDARKREYLEKKIYKKHHKRIQTKEVQKKMKKSKKKAKRHNTHTKDPWFWFKKRKK